MAKCIGMYPQPITNISPCGSDAHCSCKLYTNKLLFNLYKLWRSEYFCDVELAAGNYVVKVRLGCHFYSFLIILFFLHKFTK